MGVLTAAGPGGTTTWRFPSAVARSWHSWTEADDRVEGWPITVEDSTACEPLPLADGSVRVLCALDVRDEDVLSPIRAMAFDSNARMLPGWPVDLGNHGAEGYSAARVIGDELTIYAWATVGDSREVANSSINDGRRRWSRPEWLAGSVCELL